MTHTYHGRSESSLILAAGSNCWVARIEAQTAGLYVDARRYYQAFYEAALQAHHYLLLAGWHFTSDVRLLRGNDAQGKGQVRLRWFLQSLCRQNKQLRVYVLAWDYSFNYGLEWEWFQRRKFEGATQGRLQFRFDGNHAVGGSHHQKLVVIDGSTAFLGGLDVTDGAWDDRGHRVRHSERVNKSAEPYNPYHDIQACVTGPAAAELTAYFQRRWQGATGTTLDLPKPRNERLVLVRPSLELPAGPVALSETRPRTARDPNDHLEIHQLYLDAIACARRLIYLENQYFSSKAFFDALVKRMRATDQPRLEIVMILPKQLPSWVEAAVMGPPRVSMVMSLREIAQENGHQLGIYYSAAGKRAEHEVPVLVHSKLLIVDDRFLTIGSANISNRSMGLDTELNVSFEADGANKNLRRAIRRVRVSLLVEHCGWRRRPDARRLLARMRGLVKQLDRLAVSQEARLRVLTDEAIFENRDWLQWLSRSGFYYDPEGPALTEGRYEPFDLATRSRLGKIVDWVRYRTSRHRT